MSGTEPGRVVLLVESDPGALGLVHWAVRLAAGTRARVQAILLERAELVRVAELPFTREISRLPGVARELSVATLSGQFDRMFQRLRQQLAREAALHQVLWECERRRVERAPGDLGDIHLAEMLVTGPARGWTRRAVPPVIYVVFNGTEASERALQAGLALCAAGGLRLVLLLPDTADPIALQRRSQELLQRAGSAADRVPVQHITVHHADAMAALKVTAARLHGELLLFPAELIGLKPDNLDELLEVAPLPVVMVR